MEKKSEILTAVLALIESNLENVRLQDFKDWNFGDSTPGEVREYKIGWKEGARSILGKLREQLKGK